MLLHFLNTASEKITRMIFVGKSPQNLTQILTSHKNKMTNKKIKNTHTLMTAITIFRLTTRPSQ